MLKQSLAVLALVSLAGCGESNPPTFPVSGTVTLDGKPVEGAAVLFIPFDGTGQAASARSDASGNYKLTTFTADDGAMAGNYKIKVTKFDTPDGGMSPYGAPAETPPASSGPAKKMTEEEERARMEAGYTADQATPQGKAQVAKNELPAKYADQSSSGLTHMVVEGDNVVPLELSSKKK